MVLSDAELVREAQRADAASLGILLERHQAALYALALRLLCDGPEAQDAVQEAFLIALRDIGQVRHPEAVGGWLRTVVRNVCLRQLRKGRAVILFDEPTSRLEKELSESSAEEAIDQLALREWVWTAFSELSEDLRVTAMLRYFGSYASYEEIAAILGVPVGTVRSRLNRAKAKLAEALLKTAGLEHDEARRSAESQTRFFEAAFDDLNRKADCELFASAFSEDLAWVAIPERAVRGGLESLVYVFESDLQDGVRTPITNILVSKDVIVIEANQVNPPEDPFHCPPAISMVGFCRGSGINLLHTYEPPRPDRGEGWERADATPDLAS